MKVPLLQVGIEFPQQANSLPIQVQQLLPATARLYYLYSYKEYSTLHSTQFDHWIFGVNESEYGNTVEIQNHFKSPVAVDSMELESDKQ